METLSTWISAFTLSPPKCRRKNQASKCEITHSYLSGLSGRTGISQLSSVSEMCTRCLALSTPSLAWIAVIIIIPIMPCFSVGWLCLLALHHPVCVLGLPFPHPLSRWRESYVQTSYCSVLFCRASTITPSTTSCMQTKDPGTPGNWSKRRVKMRFSLSCTISLCLALSR